MDKFFILMVGIFAILCLGFVMSTIEKCFYFHCKSKNPDAFRIEEKKEEE